jgi:outer membrane protein TolC
MRSVVFLLCVAFGAALPASAQTPVPTLGGSAEGSLTLRDALEEAFARNPELQALRLEYEAASAVPAESRYLDAPMLEAQIWGWPVTTLNPANVGMYMFTIQQAYPGRGKRAARALVAERDAAVTRREVGVRTSEILNEVRQAFTDLALARETERLYERQVPVLRDLADASTLRYASGHSGQHEPVTSVVELTRLQAEIVTWRERARVAEATLNTLMGRAVDAPVDPLLPQALTVLPFEPTTIALERHPAMAMANAVIARQEAELARIRGERRPDLTLGGGYMVDPRGAGAWTARGAITWPNAPWSRGRLDAAVEAQQRRLGAAIARRDAAAAAIRRGVREAELRVEAARQRVTLLETTVVPHVEHAFDVSQVAYAANRGDFLEVIGGHRALLQARVELQAARAELEVAFATLELAMGDARDDRWPERSQEGSRP